MALFELDNGRLIPAQFGHEVPDGFTDDILEAIRSQVLEIVSRPLFPITWRNIGQNPSDTQPKLTALDASGQVVAVEVVQSLDADVLIDALSRLADTAAMSWTDLAREYPQGAEGFKREWIQFRDAMPTSPPNGPRLILVAANIAVDVRPALDVLTSSGVEVHEMSLRQMSNGRAFLEVDAVGPRLYGHRVSPLVEAGEVLPTLVAPSANLNATNKKQQAGGLGGGRKVFEEHDDFEDHSDPEDHGDSDVGDYDALTPDMVPYEEVVGHSPERTPIPSTEVFEAEVQTHTDQSVSDSKLTQNLPYVQEDRVNTSDFQMEQTPTAFVPSAHNINTGGDARFSPNVRPGRLRTRAEIHRSSRAPRTSGIPFPSRRQLHEEPAPVSPQRELLRNHEGLVALGQMSGADTPISLHPGSRTPRGAKLTAEGLIQVPSGRFADPTEALVSEGIFGEDGWQAWSLGDEYGPTLAEALVEVNRARD